MLYALILPFLLIFSLFFTDSKKDKEIKEKRLKEIQDIQYKQKEEQFIINTTYQQLKSLKRLNRHTFKEIYNTNIIACNIYTKDNKKTNYILCYDTITDAAAIINNNNNNLILISPTNTDPTYQEYRSKLYTASDIYQYTQNILTDIYDMIEKKELILIYTDYYIQLEYNYLTYNEIETPTTTINQYNYKLAIPTKTDNIKHSYNKTVSTKTSNEIKHKIRNCYLEYLQTWNH